MSTARRFARVILNGFDSMFAEWQNLTLGAQARFERAEWHAIHAAMAERLTIYRGKVLGVAVVTGTIAGERLHDRRLWRRAKTEFAELVLTHSNAEIAQTFFNSCYCYVFGHQKVDGLNAFALEQPLSTPASYECVVRSYRYGDTLRNLFRDILLDADFSIPFEDLHRDLNFIVEAAQQLADAADMWTLDGTRIEILDSIFYRNKAGYIIGKIYWGEHSCPLVLPLLNNERGAIYVDTALFSTDDLSILFSFTRTYFMVDIPVPSQYVRFLKSVMPNKESFELYTALGFVKHAKSEFYRTAVAHTHASDDQYVIAPGVRGMVMHVFTLPSFDYVYKIIKDHFAPPKDITREEVKAKYDFVKRSERAGRMADMHEFRNLAFPLLRFSKELLEELHRECASQIQIRGRALILKHVYVERRMTPLNLYLQQADATQTQSAMDEYGNAIKQLAAANIFPGDMLLKNFGVTRHGRVVFYDYDELRPLVDCNFRRIPAVRSEADELAEKPWYSVGACDVFPEEFRHFFSGNQNAKQTFDALHPDIYEPNFWLEIQRQINAGVVHDVFPYRKQQRFAQHINDSDF
ncbi:MAG: bifunctional isocitrate dehydrogenase kinase/phosphatase [Verrucomicrobiaceae bacterium]|nr:bifunctional isocitrate dehydrogenase kinase/phosphatase [Verrucomicrobiaceae bacterium]